MPDPVKFRDLPRGAYFRFLSDGSEKPTEYQKLSQTSYWNPQVSNRQWVGKVGSAPVVRVWKRGKDK